MDRLTEHFTPQRNVDYEIYLFRQPRQQPTETLDKFTTRLRQLASTCEFTSVEKEIKSQIIPRSREFPSPSSTCGHCGYAYPHPQGQASCPARGSQCRSCGKTNHFARCCRSKPIRPPFAESSSPRPQSRFQPPPPNSFPRQPPPREIRHVTDTQQYPTSDHEYLFTVQVSNLTTLKAKV